MPVISEIDEEVKTVSPIPCVVASRVHIPMPSIIVVTASRAMDVSYMTVRIPAQSVIQVTAGRRMAMGYGKVQPYASVTIVATSVEVDVESRVVSPGTSPEKMAAARTVDVNARVGKPRSMFVEMAATGTMTMPYGKGDPCTSVEMMPAAGSMAMVPRIVVPASIVVVVTAIRSVHVLSTQFKMGNLGHLSRSAVGHTPVFGMRHGFLRSSGRASHRLGELRNGCLSLSVSMRLRSSLYFSSKSTIGSPRFGTVTGVNGGRACELPLQRFSQFLTIPSRRLQKYAAPNLRGTPGIRSR